jgi:hypothetical protein
MADRTRAIMAVFSNPASPETEAEYNRWYDEVHVKEVLDLPGVVTATRYRLADGAHSASSEHRYLAVYEVDGSPQAVLAEFGSRDMTMSPAIDTAGARILLWEPIASSTSEVT